MTIPFITAHTGCMKTPDNSIESLEAGLLAGAEIVEVDVGVTKDSVPVLLHDSKMVLHARGTTLLADITYDELQAARIVDNHGSGIHRVTSLADILPIVKKSKKQVNLDLKSDACIDPMARLVKKENMLDLVILSGAEATRAAYIQKHYPEFRKLLNASGGLFKQTDYMSAVKKTCEDALAACCIGINISHTLCRHELVEHASTLGLPIYVWTINEEEEEEMKRMIRLGVRSITTRNVPALMRVIRSMEFFISP